MSPPRRASHRGFSLIESIIALVLLAIASASIIGLNATIFNGRSDGQAIQVGVQLMQECAEHILALRRAHGFTAAPLANSTAATASCNTMVLTGYAAPTATLTIGNSTDNGMGACPNATGSNCKLVAIQQGSLPAITLMLVNYP